MRPSMRAECEEVGISGFLDKPLRVSELTDSLEQLAERQEIEQF